MTQVISPTDFLNSAEIEHVITAIVHRLVPSPQFWEDLIDDAKIFLWQVATQRRDQTLSWYLHRLRFYLQDRLKRAPSIDSLKNGRLGQPIDPLGDADDEPACLAQEEETVSTTCAHDVLSLLLQRLDERHRAVVRLLADGCSRRDIARALRVSEPVIVDRCKHIATVARRLGISLP